MTSRLRRLAAPALMVVAVMSGACAPGGPSSSTAGATSTSTSAPSDGRTAAPAETADPIETTPDATSGSSVEGQTDTEWGRIWDSLPSGFPTYPGSEESEEAATGPASAIYVVPKNDAEAIATWMQDALEQAAYSTELLSGPLEDGSFVIESVGPTQRCRVQVSIAPLGGTTALTILYGAGCPHD